MEYPHYRWCSNRNARMIKNDQNSDRVINDLLSPPILLRNYVYVLKEFPAPGTLAATTISLFYSMNAASRISPTNSKVIAIS